MKCLFFLIAAIPVFHAQASDGLALQWYSQGEQAFGAGMAVNYFANMCPSSGLNGAQCAFTANLQDQPWEPQFDNWAEVTLVDSNGNTITSNTQNQNATLYFSYADTYGNITAEVVWGNSDALSFSFILLCNPNSLNTQKFPPAEPHNNKMKRLIPKNQVIPSATLAQYATILEAKLPNSAFLDVPVAFCFDMSQQISTVTVAVSAQDSDTNMEMYLCPNTLPSNCTPMNAQYYDTSASGFLTLSVQLQPAQYGTFTIVLKCLGQWLGTCTFSVNARLSPGSPESNL